MVHKRWIIRIAIFCLFTVVIAGVTSALAASNTVPGSHAGDDTYTVDTSPYFPPQCAGITFDRIISGSGSIDGGPGNDLIYGSDGNDNIRGGNGHDCIIAGAGNDTVRGQNGNDILDGGEGTDTIDGGPGTDTCLNGENVTTCEN
jgi:Ca2+-binding RTX toxin-like protein